MKRRLIPRLAGFATVALTTATSGLALLPASASASEPSIQPAACATPQAGHANCWAERLTSVRGRKGLQKSAPSGYGPSDIQAAYDLPQAGKGATVAIVDAYDDPNAESDLATYRSQYGLPACTTDNGCFSKVNQRGGTSYPKGDSGWSAEISLDLDAVSAACPQCHILLVEADDNNDNNLYTAVDEAVGLGAKFVSNSYSSSESSGQTQSDSHWDVPGVLFAFATGDNGYSGGTQYPASATNTLAVGGTSLRRDSSARGWGESVWSGAGSGCSDYETQSSWQADVNTGCRGEANSDVSAVADPQTGLAIYDTYGQSGWAQYGGTSLATPLITAMYALAGTPGAQDDPASYPYAHTDQLNDVTSGSNGNCGSAICSARTGWDGPTGLGTPEGVGAFTPGGNQPPPTGDLKVTNPGAQTATAGTAITPLKNSVSGGTAPYTWSASGLPGGLSIASSTGTVGGTPTTAGTYRATLTAKDSKGKTGTASFTWTVKGSGGGGTVTVTDPGQQVGFTGFQAFPLQMRATDSDNEPLTYSATGLPPGITMSSAGAASGTPTRAGTYSVTVKAADADGASGSATFSWVVYQGI
ncbi:putative Ig domain-containing protein [Streptomyces sp. NRRL F-5126]|uniref:putative Ig domain-containing protein n=1 Tax=Streptomyces sp. NRRL F-5126 TaxID=1463857 RepID=UPI00068DD6B0|nr:putative Ig domain-containing protein [Streptomyces sp. NRRL F-5126]